MLYWFCYGPQAALESVTERLEQSKGTKICARYIGKKVEMLVGVYSIN